MNIVLRVALIIALAILLSYVLTNKEWFFTPFTLVLLLIISIWRLIHYIEKTNKDLTNFILSIKQGGFTSSFPQGKKGETFRRLSRAFNDVIEEFRKINLQRETHYQYLQTLTENIQVGIISFDHSGKIELVNPAALRLLGTLRLKNIIEIKKINSKLFQVMNDLEPGQRQVFKTIMAKSEMHLSVQVKELSMNETSYKIMLIQNINQELEDQEVDAWQKLIRVLTHEIMNSVTPIVSLTEAMNTMLVASSGERRKLETLDTEDKEDLFSSLQTIEKRSRGLLRFVNAYKDFTKAPELILSQVDIGDLIEQVLSLLGPDMERNRITLEKSGVKDHFMAKVDASWLEQVVINVIRNAIDALENTAGPEIKIEALQKGSKNYISVVDNGQGMDKETLDKIFIPFFTTKKSGTGIGLSLSRQIMKLHKGSLTVTSEPDKGTVVLMEW
ncbi:MAG: ATP-binding protein [Cyclobacteriaceae bacterium]|nr:ATP-binding protein [Cyclobacteriaceae bacterium]